MNKKILCLCGGVGGAKLAYGFNKILKPENLTVVVNTGDDFEHLGFYISPDIDTVIYNLAEINNKKQGWGIEGETWQFMDTLKQDNPKQSWFNLGDKDLKTHQLRKQLLSSGKTLSETTRVLSENYSVDSAIVPMSDNPVSTFVKTQQGDDLAFQNYFVKQQCKPSVSGFYFSGIEKSQPSSGFIQALEDKDLSAVVICPSNPFVSIDPILSLPTIKTKLKTLKQAGIPIIAVSPLINGQAIKGPTAKMMDELKIPRTVSAIAKHYQDIINYFIIDTQDEKRTAEIEALGIRCHSTQTWMKTNQDKTLLAEYILTLL